MLRKALIERKLHPDDPGTLLRYAPAALTHLCWRNTILEDWHAGPDSRISDAEMMRANVSTTRIFHECLWSAIGDHWIEAGPLSSGIVDADDLDLAFFDALEIAFDRDRVLPHGVALGALAGDEADELEAFAATQLGSLVQIAQERGAHVVVMWLGLRGALAVPRWWGTPQWPFVVDEFFRRLDDPRHEHWRVIAHPGPPPESAGGRARFRDALLNAPDGLDSDVLDYCIHRVGIGFIHDGL